MPRKNLNMTNERVSIPLTPTSQSSTSLNLETTKLRVSNRKPFSTSPNTHFISSEPVAGTPVWAKNTKLSHSAASGSDPDTFDYYLHSDQVVEERLQAHTLSHSRITMSLLSVINNSPKSTASSGSTLNPKSSVVTSATSTTVADVPKSVPSSAGVTNAINAPEQSVTESTQSLPASLPLTTTPSPARAPSRVADFLAKRPQTRSLPQTVAVPLSPRIDSIESVDTTTTATSTESGNCNSSSSSDGESDTTSESLSSSVMIPRLLISKSMSTIAAGVVSPTSQEPSFVTQQPLVHPKAPALPSIRHASKQKLTSTSTPSLTQVAAHSTITLSTNTLFPSNTSRLATHVASVPISSGSTSSDKTSNSISSSEKKSDKPTKSQTSANTLTGLTANAKESKNATTASVPNSIGSTSSDKTANSISNGDKKSDKPTKAQTSANTLTGLTANTKESKNATAKTATAKITVSSVTAAKTTVVTITPSLVIVPTNTLGKTVATTGASAKSKAPANTSGKSIVSSNTSSKSVASTITAAKTAIESVPTNASGKTIATAGTSTKSIAASTAANFESTNMSAKIKAATDMLSGVTKSTSIASPTADNSTFSVNGSSVAALAAAFEANKKPTTSSVDKSLIKPVVNKLSHLGSTSKTSVSNSASGSTPLANSIVSNPRYDEVMLMSANADTSPGVFRRIIPSPTSKAASVTNLNLNPRPTPTATAFPLRRVPSVSLGPNPELWSSTRTPSNIQAPALFSTSRSNRKESQSVDLGALPSASTSSSDMSLCNGITTSLTTNNSSPTCRPSLHRARSEDVRSARIMALSIGGAKGEPVEIAATANPMYSILETDGDGADRDGLGHSEASSDIRDSRISRNYESIADGTISATVPESGSRWSRRTSRSSISLEQTLTGTRRAYIGSLLAHPSGTGGGTGRARASNWDSLNGPDGPMSMRLRRRQSKFVKDMQKKPKRTSGLKGAYEKVRAAAAMLGTKNPAANLPVTTRIPFSSPPNAGAYDCSDEYIKVVPRAQGKPTFWRHKDTGVVLHEDPVAQSSENKYYMHDDDDPILAVLPQPPSQGSDERERDSYRITEPRPIKTDSPSAYGSTGRPSLSQLLSDRLSLAANPPKQQQNHIAPLHSESPTQLQPVAPYVRPLSVVTTAPSPNRIPVKTNSKLASPNTINTRTPTSVTPSFEMWGTDMVGVDPTAEDYKEDHSQHQPANSTTTSNASSSRSQIGSSRDYDNNSSKSHNSTSLAHSKSTTVPSSSVKPVKSSWMSLSSLRMSRSPTPKPSPVAGTTSYNMSGLEETKRRQEIEKQRKLDVEAELSSDPKALWRKREEENSQSEQSADRVNSVRKSPSTFRSYMGSLLGVGRSGAKTASASQSTQPLSLA